MPLQIDYPIVTSRLQLLPFTAADGDALYLLESDPQVKRYAGGTLTRTQTEKLLQTFITQLAKTGLGAIAIKEKKTGELVGVCGLYPDDNHDGVAELFFGLARHWWGQGLVTEACLALMDAAFQQLALERIVAKVNAENDRSLRVMARIGMHCVTDDQSAGKLRYERQRKANDREKQTTEKSREGRVNERIDH